MVMGEMQTEFINEIPQYRDSPLVQKAIADMEAILLEERPEQEVSEAIEKEEPQQPMPEVKKEEKANNGITLIALVITIIVLLILAGVVIATLTGENRSINKSPKCKK